MVVYGVEKPEIQGERIVKQYAVKTLTEGRHKLFYIQDNESYEIVLHPSKYLKYKIDTNCSPNTVRRIAFALSYYMEYLSQQELEDRKSVV